MILHVTTAAAWDAARDAGIYRTPDLDSTGFIHLCHASQLEHVLTTYFHDAADLVLLHIDPSRLSAPLRYENSFPHLYGPLNLDAVTAVEPARGYTE